MEFEWDETKRMTNISKHGLDFVDGLKAFRNRLLVRKDSRKEYGEDRWQGIGEIEGQIVVLVFTERSPKRIRIISLRKANKYERQGYERFRDGKDSLEDSMGQSSEDAG
ncbi:MAG: BrnT family toxin [Nitrospirae bacterium]|nr:BrnT family toxin [Nitrospirota bacterium]MCL5285339.1 BrnT family toxin [Nitrospirota bacterium]